jgi:hypothetical protein
MLMLELTLTLCDTVQEDIEYAYAYEGVIIPGGKIMMGRWWMVGAAGEGEGRELGGPMKGERGPWVFWC